MPSGDFPCKPHESNRPIRIAVIGTGDWSRHFHLPALKALAHEFPVEIAGVWNQNGETAQLAARHFDIGRVYRSLDEAADDARADCFAVIVNSAAVKEIVARLLPRGLPILTEKPPGRTSAEARWLADAVRAPNVVAFNRRYMPINRRFKEMADVLPGAYFAECHFYRNDRPHERFVTETGIHGINFMEYLFGPVRSLRTETHAAPDGGMSWIASAVFAGGVRGVLKFFPCCGSSVERYEVHGPGRSLYLHCPQPYTSDRGRIETHEHSRLAATLDDEAGETPLGSGALDEYRDFFRAVRNATHGTASNFANAWHSVHVAEAIEAGAGFDTPHHTTIDTTTGLTA